jgi:hypothetical protein
MIVTQLGESRGAAFMTAGIFAAMPIQVESVSWMAGRFDVLSTTLGVWSVVTYLWVRARGGNARYAVALAVFALAICAKETAFVLPVLMAAIEILVFRNFPIRRLSGFAITGAVMFAYRWWTLGGFGGYRSDGASTMIGLGWKTLEALFLRGPSVTLFGFNWLQPSGSFAVVAVVAAALAIFIVVAAPLTERRRRILQMSLVWMVVAMIPGHFLLSIGAGLSNSRILCLASAGMALLLGQLVSATPQRYARNLAYAALVTVFGLGVTHNLGAWRWTSSIGEETLRQVVRMEPSPPPNAQFVISNMPRSLRGVFFFGAGLNEGFQTAYNRGDIAAYRDSAASTEHPEIRLKWTGENDGLIQRE